MWPFSKSKVRTKSSKRPPDPPAGPKSETPRDNSAAVSPADEPELIPSPAPWFSWQMVLADVAMMLREARDERFDYHVQRSYWPGVIQARSILAKELMAGHQGAQDQFLKNITFVHESLGDFIRRDAESSTHSDALDAIGAHINDGKPYSLLLRGFSTGVARKQVLGSTALLPKEISAFDPVATEFHFADPTSPLESRIAEQAAGICPMLCIADVKDQLIMLASKDLLRLRVSSNTWEFVAIALIANASSIFVLLPGLTQSVEWEMQTVKNLNKLHRCMFLIPTSDNTLHPEARKLLADLLQKAGTDMSDPGGIEKATEYVRTNFPDCQTVTAFSGTQEQLAEIGEFVRRLAAVPIKQNTKMYSKDAVYKVG